MTAANKGAPDAPTPSSDLQKLRNAIELMDALSAEGFDSIAAIADLALLALETPEGCRNLIAIGAALDTIRNQANRISNFISCQAEEVGCADLDDAKMRRLNAAFAVRKGAQA